MKNHHKAASSKLDPSEYTAALIQALRADALRFRGATVLEMGSGSGVVLAVLGQMGASQLCGIDVEDDAIEAGTSLMEQLSLSRVSRFHKGDMWKPVISRKFNLIVANLPHFPMEQSDDPNRHGTWSIGGQNGRALLDPFLEGLNEHLLPEGRAVITHNAFVGIERTREILAAKNMTFKIVGTRLVHIPGKKMNQICEQVLNAEKGRTIHCIGPHTFGDMHVIEITAQNKGWKIPSNNAM